ncbi:MAG: DNA polymerase I [Spirochaetales bacterium]
MKIFLVIDGNSLINRAFYALPLLKNSMGSYSNAIYGFCNMLVKAINEYEPQYIAVAFDRKEPTFRHKLYTDYKGTRKGMPNELAEQMPILKQVLEAMNIKILEKAGIEADDIIGVISKRFKEQTVILTGDRDTLQLIDDTTSVWLTKKGLSELEKVDEKVLLEEFKLKPYQVIELKSLMGDASDNIPGVSGIGEKTAMQLLEKYDNLDGVYAHIDEQTGKLKEKLENGKDIAYLSRTLATIDTTADVDIKIEDCTYDYPFSKDVYELFKKYEFKSLLKREELFEKTFDYKPQLEKKTLNKAVENLEVLKALVTEIKKAGEVAIYLGANLHISISKFEEYEIKIKENLLSDGLNLEEVLNELRDVLQDENIKKVLFDYKASRHYLKDLGYALNGASFDIGLAEYLVSGSKRQEGDMLAFTEQYNYSAVAIASCMLKAKDELIKRLKEQEMYDLYYNVEFKLIDVLYNMEINGFKIDMDILNELNFKYDEESKKLTNHIYTLAGEEFNINSPKQLSEVLFDKLKIYSANNKKKSTNVSVLERLVDDHPIIELIMRYRHITKLNGTYLEGFKKLIDKKTNLVHTLFNQTLTSTGRLSSTEPNLQNIPVRTEDGKNLRRMFVTRFEDGFLVTADYSQIELRLMAHYSKDENLIEAFKEGKDIHTATASDIFGVPESAVTPTQRRDAKAVNFGIIYGISDYGLSQNIGSSRIRAKDYIEKYFATYPGVKRFMETSVEVAKANGYVSTLMGRRRNIDDINSSNYVIRQAAERAAMNMPLQGTASDIIKLAMIRVYNKFKKLNLKAKLILQVHDELIVDTPKDEKDIVISILKQEMELVAKLEVPLVVDINYGKCWLDAK